jgi:hypothetical protein
MTPCSRCASTSPNSSCFVCAEPEQEEKPYDDCDDDNGHDDYLERILDRADRFYTEQKDREFERP